MDPEDWVISAGEVGQALGRPVRTVQRWIQSGLWGLGVGEGSMVIDRVLVVRREVVTEVAARLGQSRRSLRRHERLDPPDPVIDSPLSALIAAVDAADGPVTLHQVATSFGGEYEAKDLAAAAVGALRRRQLERTLVDKPTERGRSRVWAYMPGPGFARAKSRRPRILQRLKAEQCALEA